jgi:hypothetical protein
MSRLYAILAILGWIWLAVAIIMVVGVRWWRGRRGAQRGFEIVDPNEKQS